MRVTKNERDNPMVTANFVSGGVPMTTTDRTGFEPVKRFHVYTLSSRVQGKATAYKRSENQGLAAPASIPSGEFYPPVGAFSRNQRVTGNVGRPGPTGLSGSSTVAPSFTYPRTAPGTSPRLLPAPARRVA